MRGAGGWEEKSLLVTVFILIPSCVMPRPSQACYKSHPASREKNDFV